MSGVGAEFVAFVVQVVATIYMTGVIWVIQVVHYPLFAGVGPAAFGAYEAGHRERITLVVLLPMVAELATAAWLARRPLPFVPPWSARLGLALLVAVWASTALLQVPLHDRLSARFDPAAIAALVRGNWLRTAAWTARTLLCAWWLARGLGR